MELGDAGAGLGDAGSGVAEATAGLGGVGRGPIGVPVGVGLEPHPPTKTPISKRMIVTLPALDRTLISIPCPSSPERGSSLAPRHYLHATDFCMWRDTWSPAGLST